MGLQTRDKVYIHEHLTKPQSDLYFRAKDVMKEASYKYIWTRDQKIYIRYNETSKPTNIESEADLLKIVSEPGDSTANVTSIAAVPDLRRGRLRSEHKQQINSAGQR